MAFLPALIAAGSTLASTIAGVDANNKNAKAAANQNAAQNALNAKSIALAEKMDQEGLATQVDANGNITYYDAQTNTWRTILAPQQAQINDASNTELLRSLSIDAPMARGEALRNSQSKLLDQGTADTLRTQQNNVIAGKGEQKSGDLASSLRLSRQAAVNAGFDQTQTALNTQQLRTGTGVGTAGADLARARADAIAQGMGNPDLEGLQVAKDMNSSDVSDAINRYGTVANRAYSTNGYTPPNPSITPALSTALAASRNAGATGSGNAAQIINQIKVPTPAAAPNYASLIASLGNSASSLFKASQTPTNRGSDLSDWRTDAVNYANSFTGG
jgi:hypothetical protein